jgi:hypothetical protein
MLRKLEQEEMALRRRLLFRLLRRFDFDRPELRGEMISTPVPDSLIASEYAKQAQAQGRHI